MHVLTSSPSHRSSPSQSKPSPSKPSQLTTALALSALCIVGSGCFYELDRAANLAVGEVRGTLTLQDGSQAAYAEITISGRPTSTLAGSQGAFSVTDLPSGKWLVRFAYDADGDGWPEQSGGRSFIMLPGQGVDLGEVRLFGVGALSGVVHDAAGQPVGGAKVVATVTHESDDDALGFTYEETTVTSATDGRYFFAALPGARAQVLAFEPARPEAVSPSREVTLSPNETVPTGEPLVLPAMPSDRRPVTLDLVPPPAAGEDVFVEIVPPGTPATDYDFSTAPPGDPRVLPFTLPFVLDLPGGLWDIRLKTSSNKKGAALRRVIKPGRGVLDLGNLNLVDQFCPDGDCDGDGIVGLPPYAEAPDVWAACHAANAECALASGIRTEDKSCTVDGTQYDCEDDGDGQADLTEPTCYGVGLGTDRDGDLLCDGEDPYPYCRANDETCVPEDVENLDPQPQLPDLPTDAGIVDAGPEDAGVVDAGPEDAGVELDAGIEDAGVDAGIGVPDAGPTDAGPTDAGVVDPPFDGEWEWAPDIDGDFHQPIGLVPLDDGRTVIGYWRSTPLPGCPMPNEGTYAFLLVVLSEAGACELSRGFNPVLVMGQSEATPYMAGSIDNEVVLITDDFFSTVEVTAVNIDDGSIRTGSIGYVGGNANFSGGAVAADGSVVTLLRVSQGTTVTIEGNVVTSPQESSTLVRVELDTEFGFADLFSFAASGASSPDPGNVDQILALDSGDYLVMASHMTGEVFTAPRTLSSDDGDTYVASFTPGQDDPTWLTQMKNVDQSTMVLDRPRDEVIVGATPASSPPSLLAAGFYRDAHIIDEMYIGFAATYTGNGAYDTVAWMHGTKSFYGFEFDGQGSTTIFAFDTQTYSDALLATVPFDVREPFVDELGQLFAVTSDGGGSTLSFIDPVGGTVVPLASTPVNTKLGYDPTTRNVYRANGNNEVSFTALPAIIDVMAPPTLSFSTVPSAPACSMSADHISVSHDGSTLLIGCGFSQNIVAWDLQQQTSFWVNTLSPILGQNPMVDLQANIDGSYAYFTTTGNAIWRIALEAGANVESVDGYVSGPLSFVTPPPPSLFDGTTTTSLHPDDLLAVRIDTATGATGAVDVFAFTGSRQAELMHVVPLLDGGTVVAAACPGDASFVDATGATTKLHHEAPVLASTSEEVCWVRMSAAGAYAGHRMTHSSTEQDGAPISMFPDGSSLTAVQIEPEVRFGRQLHGQFVGLNAFRFYRHGVQGPTLDDTVVAPSPSLVELPSAANSSIDYTHVKAMADGSFLVGGKVNVGEAFPDDPDCATGVNPLFVAKITAAADCLWLVPMGAETRTGQDRIDDIALGPDGEAYVMLSNNQDISYFDGTSTVGITSSAYSGMHAVLHIDNAGDVIGTAAVGYTGGPASLPGALTTTHDVDAAGHAELVMAMQAGTAPTYTGSGSVDMTGIGPDSLMLVRLDSDLVALDVTAYDAVQSVSEVHALAAHRVVVTGTVGGAFDALTSTDGASMLTVASTSSGSPGLTWSALVQGEATIPRTQLAVSPGGARVAFAIESTDANADIEFTSTDGTAEVYLYPGDGGNTWRVAWLNASFGGQLSYAGSETYSSFTDGTADYNLQDISFGESSTLRATGMHGGVLSTSYGANGGNDFGADISVAVSHPEYGARVNTWNVFSNAGSGTSVTAAAPTLDDGMVLLGPLSSDGGLETGDGVLAPTSDSSFLWVVPGDASFTNPEVVFP